MTSRKILIIVISIVCVILIVGFYFLFFAQNTATVGGTINGQTGSLPATGDQSTSGNAASGSAAATGSAPTLAKNFGVISANPTLDYFVSSANIVTAIEPNGTIIQVAGTQQSTLSSLQIQNILTASFSYDGTKILVNFGDPTNPQTSIFDIATKEWMAINQKLISPAWSPSDYRVVYTIDNTNGTESFATLDGSKVDAKPVIITTLHAQDLAVAWPTKTQIVFYTKPSAYSAGSIWLFNLQKATLIPIAVEVSGIEALWSDNAFAPATPMGLEFTTGASGLGGSLALTDLSGNIIQQLKFQSLPSKCLFVSATSTTNSITTSTPYLYCGVPRDQDALSLAHLPDDYNQMALFTSDDIYQINLQNGVINTVFDDPTQNIDVSDAKFFNGTLFFINRYDQKLYAIQF